MVKGKKEIYMIKVYYRFIKMHNEAYHFAQLLYTNSDNDDDGKKEALSFYLQMTCFIKLFQGQHKKNALKIITYAVKMSVAQRHSV